MKISLEWLREYADFGDDPQELAEILTHVGFPVEECRQVGRDWMLDVEVTSNRPDCLGHIGLAREVAAVTGAELKIPNVDFPETGLTAEQLTSVTNDSPQLCGRYTARVIQGVRVGPSPDWMVRRLETTGQRSISNVVDITNYVLMEVGQPLHIFDLDKLGGNCIIVRQARAGETMVTIDHSKIELAGDMLLIADKTQPVAIAGIMGGSDSEVTAASGRILLESAWFAPLSIRRTSRALSLASESSFRFERNVSLVQVDWASRRAAALLVELASGQVAAGMIDSWPQKPQPRQIDLRHTRLKKLLGIEIDRQQVTTILDRLGLAPQFDQTMSTATLRDMRGPSTSPCPPPAAGRFQDRITCTVPVWRSDLAMEADLIEEVIRIHGYRHIPTEKAINITVKTVDAHQRTRAKVATVLNSCGFFETVNVSFIEDRYWPLFAKEGYQSVRVQDMSRRTNNALRHTLLPSLLGVRKYNQDVGNGRCDLYELATVHENIQGADAPQEALHVGLTTDGSFRELRGVIDALIAQMDKQARVTWQPHDLRWSKPGSGARLLIGDALIGQAGIAHTNILKTYDIESDLCLAQIHFDALIRLEQSQKTRLQTIARFPGITRDLSLVLDDAIGWDRIEETIVAQAIDELCHIEFVGIYRGKGIEPGEKSLTLSLEFRREHETLTHEQVDPWQDKILAALQKTFQVRLRA